MANLLQIRSMGAAENQVSRDFNKKTRELVMLASTKSVDCYGSIILPSAFQASMAQYMKNPVILKNHDRRGDVYGATRAYELTDDHLQKSVQFAPNLEAERLFTLYAEGYANAWSVGGAVPYANMVHAMSPQKELDALPRYALEALKERKARVVYTQFRLDETSAVTIGANPDALTRAAEDGVISLDIARGMYEDALEAMSWQALRAEVQRVNEEIDEADRLGANLTISQQLALACLTKFHLS